MRREIVSDVDGGLSGGLSVRTPGNEAPYRRQQKFPLSVTQELILSLSAGAVQLRQFDYIRTLVISENNIILKEKNIILSCIIKHRNIITIELVSICEDTACLLTALDKI